MNLEVATKRLLHQLVKIPGSFSAMFVHGSVPLQLFRVVWIFLRFLGVICYDRWFLSEGLKNYFRDWCLMNSQPTFFIFNLFKLNELWPYYQKHVNQIILNHTTLWSLALQTFELWIFPWIKLSWHSCSVWDKPGWLKWFWQFLFEGLSPLILKYSSTHMHGLTVYLKEGLAFAWDLSLENSADSFSSINHLLHLCAQFYILFHLT